jgi:hypothetical protein
MPVQALSGHGTQVLVTLDYAGAPTVFTLIPGLRGEITKKLTRAKKEVTAHDQTVDEQVFSRVMKRGAWTFMVNFNPSNSTHMALRDLFMSNEQFKVKSLAFGGVVDTTDDITMYGAFTDLEWKDGEQENERSMTLEFTPSGAFQMDGVTYQ